MTTETELMNQALERDLERYRDYVDKGDPDGYMRIMARMIDTVMDLEGCDRVAAINKISDLIRASN